MSQDTQSGFINVNGTDVYYEIAGQGEVLVLAHAGFVDSRMWDAQWNVFTQYFRVVRFDMRGFGQSEPITGPVSRYDDLYQLLKKLGITSAHLVGSSMSGTAVLDLALEHPEMVKSLVMVCSSPSGFEMQGEPPRYLFDMIGAMQSGDFEHATELAIRIWFDGMYRESNEVDASIRAKVTEMNRVPMTRNTFFIGDSQPLNPLNPPAVTRLGEVKQPILLVVGDLDHPEVVRSMQLMAEEIPHAQYVVIENTAHLPSVEKPDEFNQVLLDFVTT